MIVVPFSNLFSVLLTHIAKLPSKASLKVILQCHLCILKTYEPKSYLHIQFVHKFSLYLLFQICADISCFVKGWVSFSLGSHDTTIVRSCPQMCYHIVRIWFHIGTSHHLHFSPWNFFNREFEEPLLAILDSW